MNWAQFKDPVSHMCFAGTVVASWPLTQEVTGSSPFNDKYFLPLNSRNSVKTFKKNSNVVCSFASHVFEVELWWFGLLRLFLLSTHVLILGHMCSLGNLSTEFCSQSTSPFGLR